VRARASTGASLSASDADPGATAASSLATALGGVPEGEMLARIAANAAAYVAEIAGSLQDAVPKAVMCCLVRRVERELLPEMYGAMNAKSATELKELVEDAPADVAARRDALRRALPHLADALRVLRAATAGTASPGRPAAPSPRGRHQVRSGARWGR
jgi:hypothetical protein